MVMTYESEITNRHSEAKRRLNFKTFLLKKNRKNSFVADVCDV